MQRLLITADAVGGVWQYATDLAVGLARRGVRVVLAVMGPAAAPFRPAGIEVIETGWALDWTARDAGELAAVRERLRALAVAERVTGVHLHAPALAGGMAVPAVAVAHSCVGTWWERVRGGPLPADLQWRAEETRRGLLAAGAVAAPTRAFAAQVEGLYGLGAGAVHVIHNGRDPGAPVPAAPEGHVLTAGRLWDEGKNVAALDRAAASVPIRAAGAVAGPGGTAGFAHLRLLGVLSAGEMAAERARASVFASMPVYEPFGLAVLEAAQCGLPLVLSDIPTLRELWDGAAEFVAAEADLVPALRRVLAAPGDLGGRARARAARYTVETMVDQTLALHRSLA